jgi:predicted dienelactone hydrolase
VVFVNPYDPLLPGPATVATRSFRAEDSGRSRHFPIDVWYGDTREPAPLVVFSHHSGGDRRSAAYLCEHLASHGYVVAAMDHSEGVASELRAPQEETAEARKQRIADWIANRVPDLRFLIDRMLEGRWGDGAPIASSPCGAMGMSFGGWSVLAAPETDARIGSIVAIVPAGSSQPRPGILPVSLSFDWSGRDVPVLYVAAENDTSTPLAGVMELHQRTPGERRFFALRDADHLHFMSAARELHERVLTMEFPPELSWIRDEMRPFAELTPEQDAHDFVASLALAHFDATLRGDHRARTFLDDEALSAFERYGIRALRLG